MEGHFALFFSNVFNMWLPAKVLALASTKYDAGGLCFQLHFFFCSFFVVVVFQEYTFEKFCVTLNDLTS